VLSHVRLRAALLLLIEERGGFVAHEVRGLDLHVRLRTGWDIMRVTALGRLATAGMVVRRPWSLVSGSRLILFTIHDFRKVPQFIRLALCSLHIALEFL
jgi:hypothetical protein